MIYKNVNFITLKAEFSFCMVIFLTNCKFCDPSRKKELRNKLLKVLYHGINNLMWNWRKLGLVKTRCICIQKRRREGNPTPCQRALGHNLQALGRHPRKQGENETTFTINPIPLPFPTSEFQSNSRSTRYIQWVILFYTYM